MPRRRFRGFVAHPLLHQKTGVLIERVRPAGSDNLAAADSSIGIDPNPHHGRSRNAVRRCRIIVCCDFAGNQRGFSIRNFADGR